MEDVEKLMEDGAEAQAYQVRVGTAQDSTACTSLDIPRCEPTLAQVAHQAGMPRADSCVVTGTNGPGPLPDTVSCGGRTGGG